MAHDTPLLHEAEGDTGSFGAVAIVLQAVITAVFAASTLDVSKAADTDQSSIYNYYVGVALMMFVGFGYLMTFLKAYGLGAVGFTMFITCIGVEFAMIIESAMVKGGGRRLSIDFEALLNANFAVAAVLISFGGVIGKIGPVQILLVTLLELIFYCLNKVYFLHEFHDVSGRTPLIGDAGGTIIIHVFGAYFGLACARVLGPASDVSLNGSNYISDLFSLVGTVFLWLFWPSFVAGALPGGADQTRALLNTVLALLASTVVTFGLTPLLQGGKIGTVPIQNATLAGGVAIRATADLVGAFGAICIGGLAGLISTWGFIKEPLFGHVDTCGIHNLHGMPGMLGGIFSILVPFMYKDAPTIPWRQAVGLFGTLGVAIVTGAFTGGLLKMLGSPKTPFNDAVFWECGDDIPNGAEGATSEMSPSVQE